MSPQSRLNGLLMTLLLLLGTSVYPAGQSWPLKREVDLSSGFGDFRENRFHAGLDIRTGGKIGSKIYSPVDGWVWRVRTSYIGYGKGLYVKDAAGRFYVYGHMSDFAPKIDKIVKKTQYDTKRYNTDLTFPKDSIPVKKGEFLGLTGQTGAGAPHLHYEVRSPENRPLNPLKEGWTINEKIRPTFERIGFTLVDDSSIFDDGARMKYFDVKRTNTGQYTLDTVLFINAPFGISTEVYDQMKARGMRQAVYSLTLAIDGVTLYKSVLDSLDFEQGPSVNLEYDYAEAAEGRTRTRRLFHCNGNIYPGSSANGNHGGIFGAGEYPAVDFHNGEITAVDAFGNTSVLNFRFFWGPPDDFYEFDTIMAADNKTPVAYLKPRYPELKLGADSINLEYFASGTDRFIDTENLIELHKEADGWLSFWPDPNYGGASAIFMFLPDSRLVKRFPDGSVRYEQVMDSVTKFLYHIHYPPTVPLKYQLTDDGLAVRRQWDGIYMGKADLKLAGNMFEKTFTAPQRWESDCFVYFIPTDSITDPITTIITGEPMNDTLPTYICKIGDKKNGAVLYDGVFRVGVSSDDLYEPRLIEINTKQIGQRSKPTPVSKSYRILPEAFVTKQPFTVELRVDSSVENPDKTGLCWWDEKEREWVWINDDSLTTGLDGLARGKSQGGGVFAALTDNAPPRIRNVNITNGSTVPTTWPEVRFDLVDSLSGIADDRSIEVRINDEWLIPEYDPERETLVAKPYRQVTPGDCKLTISVVDRVGNRTELSRKFRVVEK